MIAQVILDTSSSQLDRIFDYEIPFLLLSDVALGVRVQVPFGNKNATAKGYVVGLGEESDVPEEKLKQIKSVLDGAPVFSPEEIWLAHWMKERYFTTLSRALQLITPTKENRQRREKAFFLAEGIDLDEAIQGRENPKSRRQREVLLALQTKGVVTRKELGATGLSLSAVETLTKQGILVSRMVEKEESIAYEAGWEKATAHALTKEQQAAVTAILSEDRRPLLLWGVTGSGKTEVYLSAIETLLSQGKTAIVLVPEIALTPQLFSRFEARFGALVACTHSRMTKQERLLVWQKAAAGEVRVVIGPRSAVFAPLPQLGLIVVDEAHDQSYRSEQAPRYDAREVAQVWCQKKKAKLVLGTATPSVEQYFLAKGGDYGLVELSKRIGNVAVPRVDVVDMAEELASGHTLMFSRRLLYAMDRALKANKQVLLFLNRRGFSTFVSCRKCGYVATCDHCSVAYTYHGKEQNLQCHYCGKTVPVPTVCPVCGSKYIRFFGSGTEKVEAEVRRLFPKARILRMDKDTTTKKNSYHQILSAFAKKEADILIGTQMIAKGHDFADVVLVGVLAADGLLFEGELGSTERAFQLLTQVIGRAGRKEGNGLAVVQTYQPRHYVVQAAAKHQAEAFYEAELAARQMMDYPPFCAMVCVMATGEVEERVQEMVAAVKEKLEQGAGLEVLGPSPARLRKIQNQYRWQVFAKGKDEEALRSQVKEVLKELQGRFGGGVHLQPIFPG